MTCCTSGERHPQGRFRHHYSLPGSLKIVAADPDDDAVVECAVVGQAAFIVSGDRHLLALGGHAGIRIFKAADFLTLL
jgi:predicted nucleic acid-binding protein